jgi:N utilization substance protein A
VAHALSPARVLRVNVVDAQARVAQVIVPDYQLSLAIGKEGQNARLAARLTGWKIDIQPDRPADPADPGAAASTRGAARGERDGASPEPADASPEQPADATAEPGQEAAGGPPEPGTGPAPGAPGTVRGGADAPAR